MHVKFFPNNLTLMKNLPNGSRSGGLQRSALRIALLKNVVILDSFLKRKAEEIHFQTFAQKLFLMYLVYFYKTIQSS